MSSLLDLFSVLDGWGESRIGSPIPLNPDPVLMSARTAIAQGAKLDEALAAVQEQIDIARPLLRGLLFDVVETQTGNASPEILRRMLCYLHLAAARITMRKRQWHEARGHLLCAAACESGNPFPELVFVELYVETGEYLSAITTLEKATKGRGDAAFSLFELANDLAARGAGKDAKVCLSRVVKNDEIGTIAAIARIRLADVATTDFNPPSESQMEALCQSGIRAMGRGEPQEALHSLFRVLSLRPREGRVWFFVGYLFCVGVGGPGDFHERANATRKMAEVSISAERYKELLQAEQALKLACTFNPELVEANVQLASCYLLLDRPDAVIECADDVFRQRPNNAQAYSLLSQVLLGAGDPLRAARAARDALEIDSQDPLAIRTLSILLKSDELLREAVQSDLLRKEDQE
jgi:tetratricopeptide (TPR) repeat protein